MKSLLYLIAVIGALLAALNPANCEEGREHKPRFKGVELYSWKNEKGEWTFALLDGTNREKTEREVKSSKGAIIGAEKLKQALRGLAAGESVSWCHRINGFEYLDRKLRDEIIADAKQADVELNWHDPEVKRDNP